MKYDAFIKNSNGELIKMFTGETSKSATSIDVSESYRIPRTFGIKNIEGNEDIYNKLLNHVGKTLRMESDNIKGLFNISLEKDEILLKEVI
jgi:hypothetical protein